MDALALKQVKASRGGQPVISGFSLLMQTGTSCALIGPSGTGKSTLLGLICGILQPDSGTIVVAGQDLTQLSAAARDAHRAATMGVVFQNIGLARALSVEANLKLALRMAGKPEDPDRLSQLLQDLGVEHRSSAKPRQLSRGEAQRAAIARALVVQPQLLIADEPTASLDTAWRDKVMDLLMRRAGEDGMTLLVSTHDAAVAQRLEKQIKLPLGRPA
ncbi:MAG: ATP-binding cassette domain-containing protein [Pseudomonadota bacterium]